MHDTKQILAVLDPDAESHPALERAARLAPLLNAAVELYFCYPELPVYGAAFVDGNLLQSARAELGERYRHTLEELARPLRELGIPVSVHAEPADSVFRGVIARVAAADADLMILSAAHDQALGRHWFGNTQWQIARSVPCPVWFASDQSLPPAPRLAAAVDPMHEHDKPAVLDQALLRVGAFLANRLHGELEVLHCVPMDMLLTDVAIGGMMQASGELLDETRELHRKRLHDLVEEAGIADDRVHLLEGIPAQQIREYCQSASADVLIIGVISRSMIQRAIIGSTAERVLGHVSCDLLLLKPESFQGLVDENDMAQAMAGDSQELPEGL